MKISNMAYFFKHLSFDLWLTLIKSNPEFKPAKVEFIRKHYNPMGHSADSINEIMRNIDRKCTRLCEITGRNFNPIDMWGLILLEMGYEEKTKILTESKLYAIHQNVQELYLKYPPLLYSDDTLPILEILYKNTELMTIGSNTGFVTGTSVRKALKKLGILQFFRGEVFSDECGWAKPDEHFFEEVLKLSHFKEKNQRKYILHVGDNTVADMEGPRYAGIHSFIINNPDSKFTIKDVINHCENFKAL